MENPETKEMKTIHMYYSSIPCQGKDCIHWDGEYEEVIIREAGFDYWHKWHEELKTIWYGYRCNKSEDLGIIRQEIYNRADKAAEKCYTDGRYVKPWIQAGKTFDEIANEWRNMKCPFYRRIK